MGKSIRSKREKRLRTLRRKIAEPHYDAKDEKKLALLEAIVNAPSPYTLDVASKPKASSLPPASALKSAEASNDALGDHGAKLEDHSADAGEAMAVEGVEAEAPGAAAAAAGTTGGKRRSRRGGLAKKKVKLSKKAQRKLRRKAEFPV